MNIKRVIGASLAVLGTGGFIFAVILFILTLGWENPACHSRSCGIFPS